MAKCTQAPTAPQTFGCCSWREAHIINANNALNWTENQLGDCNSLDVAATIMAGNRGSLKQIAAFISLISSYLIWLPLIWPHFTWT